jgi:site-specific DNA recombinase
VVPETRELGQLVRMLEELGPKKSSRKLRCAIYTRKSTEEGLEQDFNSLDAQREACEAFIASQKHEGWMVLPAHYDDGGYSGGTLERPALQRLLDDIRGSKLDVIVVYKIDRLTRSLLDFAEIVEVFDAHGVSFVSVTQAFNTATSMGRLTLNVLLSFAQFEREVTGERIRDKIAASKKKGMWMGGYPPLGYDVKDRKLIVNETEAETVRYIFRRYQDLSSVRLLKEHLDAVGIVSKRRTAPDGRAYGSKPMTRGERSTTCCRTASIGARSYIRIRLIPASTRRSSMRSSGRGCRRSWRRIGSIVLPATVTTT